MQYRRRNDGHLFQQERSSIDLPQAFPDDVPPRKQKGDYYSRQHNRHVTTTDREPVHNNGKAAWFITFTLLILVVLGSAYFFASEHEKVQIEHVRQDIFRHKLEPLSRQWEEKYARLQDENERLKSHEQEFKRMQLEHKQLIESQDQQQKSMLEQNKQIEYYRTYQERIHERIKLVSRALLLEKFGAGPHHVEISVAFAPGFPKKDDSDVDQQRFVIELAPTDEMPHVVYWFLEQVTRGLYDGCSFHRNAGHVIQGGPAPNFLSPPKPKLYNRFVQSGFHSILFQEYSSTFPHEKYTLGLAGRPGGPDFYISTRDNVKLHGPGGQTSYDDPSEADPCFAKVIEGFEVVDRMQLGPVAPGGYKAFVDNVAIVSMKLLPAA